jgi:hypothetical protein
MKNTFLYIKEHTITGMKYFGKTTRLDIEAYLGSGVYWNNHLKIHGKKHVKTLWVSEPFTDENDIKEFATLFSEEFDIVNSNEWANLMIEDGLQGRFPILEITSEWREKLSHAAKNRKPISEETRNKMSIAAKNRSQKHKDNLSKSRTGLLLGRKASEETKLKMSIARIGKKKKPHSEEAKLKMSIAAKNRKKA